MNIWTAVAMVVELVALGFLVRWATLRELRKESYKRNPDAEVR